MVAAWTPIWQQNDGVAATAIFLEGLPVFPEWQRDGACLEHPELDWFRAKVSRPNRRKPSVGDVSCSVSVWRSRSRFRGPEMSACGVARPVRIGENYVRLASHPSVCSVQECDDGVYAGEVSPTSRALAPKTIRGPRVA